MSWLRFPVALLASALITVALFSVLNALISTRAEVGEQLALSKVEFVRLKRSVEIEERKREKVERAKPEQTPVMPTLAMAKEDGVELGLDVSAIAAGLGAEFGSAGGGDGRGALAFDAGLSDRDPLPLVRVEPEYPPQARQRRLEGWVQVRFTISTGGSVRDAVVVKSSHSMFERYAVQAVNKWKYQPLLRGGQPTEAPGQQVVVRFQMEGET